MNSLLTKSLSGCLLSLAVLALPSLMAQSKPSLSAEVAAVMEAEGVAAAKQRFAEIYPARKDEYDVDPQEMVKLSQGYMQAGDMEAGMALVEMMSMITVEMSSAAMKAYSPQMAEMAQNAEAAERTAWEQEKEDREREQKNLKQQQDPLRGEPRSDLERFKGIFGDASDNERLRTLFVTVSCDGYLVTGPMWADVGPWWMRSAADRVFTYADAWTNLSIEFSGSGEALTLSHDIEGVTSPLRWLGSLPADWDTCLARPVR